MVPGIVVFRGLFLIVAAVLRRLIQRSEVKLQLFAAVGADHLTVLQNGLIKIDGLLAGGAGGSVAVLILVGVVLIVLVVEGLTGVFSLTGWSRQIRAGFLVSRVTQDTTRPSLTSRTGLSPSTDTLSRMFRS